MSWSLLAGIAAFSAYEGNAIAAGLAGILGVFLAIQVRTGWRLWGNVRARGLCISNAFSA